MRNKIRNFLWNIIKPKPLPKKRQETSVFLVSNIDCLICGTKNIEITEQGLCESCGNVIV